MSLPLSNSAPYKNKPFNYIDCSNLSLKLDIKYVSSIGICNFRALSYLKAFKKVSGWNKSPKFN